MKRFIVGLMVLVLVNIAVTVIGWVDSRDKLDHIEENYISRSDSLLRSVQKREDRIDNWYRNHEQVSISDIYWE